MAILRSVVYVTGVLLSKLSRISRVVCRKPGTVITSAAGDDDDDDDVLSRRLFMCLICASLASRTVSLVGKRVSSKSNVKKPRRAAVVGDAPSWSVSERPPPVYSSEPILLLDVPSLVGRRS